MAGGSATHAGIAFQDQVAGLLSVHVVADAPVDFFGLPAGVTPTSIALETSAPVDDILVGTSAGGFCFVNVKRGVITTTKTDAPLTSVVDQFVRLWIACEQGSGSRPWQRPLDPKKDRAVLVTGGDRSGTFAASLSKVIGRIADGASPNAMQLHTPSPNARFTTPSRTFFVSRSSVIQAPKGPQTRLRRSCGSRGWRSWIQRAETRQIASHSSRNRWWRIRGMQIVRGLNSCRCVNDSRKNEAVLTGRVFGMHWLRAVFGYRGRRK
jgi:hypothetical protein